MDGGEFLERVAAGEKTFSNIELNGVDLAGVDLRQIRLSGARLTDVDLHGSNLTLADFSQARLIRVRLSGAHLFGISLQRISPGLTFVRLTCTRPIFKAPICPTRICALPI
jgi:uncharacterized protein YjbI with pentapeptide repeats